MSAPPPPARFTLQTHLIVAFGFVLFCSKSILIKLAYRYNVAPETLLALRMIAAAPFYIAVGIWSAFRGEPRARVTKRQWLGVGVAGVVGYYLASLLDLMGLQYISAGLERLILYTYPLLVLILSRVLYKRRFQLREIAAMLAAYLGLGFIVQYDLNIAGPNVAFGSALVVASAACFAVFVVVSGRLIPTLGSQRFTTIAMLVSGILVGCHFGLISEQSLLDFPIPVYGIALTMGILCTVVPSYLVAAGIARIGAERTAIVGMIGPASTLIGAYLILDERIASLQILGAICVVGSVAYIAIASARSATP